MLLSSQERKHGGEAICAQIQIKQRSRPGLWSRGENSTYFHKVAVVKLRCSLSKLRSDLESAVGGKSTPKCLVPEESRTSWSWNVPRLPLSHSQKSSAQWRRRLRSRLNAKSCFANVQNVESGGEGKGRLHCYSVINN